MESQIKEALSRSVCGGWDRGFLESILEQIGRGRKLSAKQIETVSKVLDRNDESSQTMHDQWADTYALEHADNAKCLAIYYARTGYFRELSRDIIAGEVPDYRAYTKMSSNKYAQKVLETHNAAPKYEVGTLVVARANFQSSNAYFDREDTTRLPWVTVNDVLSKAWGRWVLCLQSEGRIEHLDLLLQAPPPQVSISPPVSCSCRSLPPPSCPLNV